MPQVDVVDETWIAADPARVADRVADPANWRRWWPDLDLAVDELRGREGVRWLLPDQAMNALGLAVAAGSMEVWLQPDRDGVRVHFFLRLDPADGRRLPPRRVQRLVSAHRRRAKRVFWALKDELEVR
ncbi:MAG TPA: polyketide cyclase / dehydrase and lipid transport [Jatrophihabitantaceae bacterium]|jgi:hypothetical protein